MAKLEDQLNALSHLQIDAPAESPEHETVTKALIKAIKSTSNHVIAKAAQLICESKRSDLCDDLARAFDRLLQQPAKRDKGGSALTALAKSLAMLDYQDADCFARGSVHIQMEPVYGGKVDVADHMRGWCAQGLAQTGDPDALTHIARLLADPCSQTRKAAIQAVEITGRADVGIPLLNFKINQGDPNPQVIGQCVTAIFNLTNETGLHWIKPMLANPDSAVVEQVLLAMGQSRLEGLCQCLQDYYEQTLEADLQKTTLLSLAMLRTDQSLTFLTNLVEDGSTRAAEQAIDSLGIYSYDNQLGDNIASICRDRGDTYLLKRVESIFAS